jgi:tRNA A-37 threonylcarbamoyl transferase component Bud32
MTNPSTCPKCGATISEDAPQNLCPKCVLLGAATNAEAPQSKGALTPTVPEVAAHFPELEILELIGVGGMGVVFKARQPKLDRLVALKILSRELAGDPAFAERFDREARVLARLNHPNIVTVFDCGMAGPFAYLMMEFVDGVNLRQAMQTGRFKPAEALALVQDVCGALKFAHEKDILHRDIKPENILIDSRGHVKIADFGIAKLVGDNEHDNVTLTQEGALLGSPRYMAPEQFHSPGDVDQRADIYSLGVVLYELLTGELPMGRFAPPSKKSAVDARIDEIVMRTLERERELRFQTIGEVKTRVEDVTQSGNTSGRGSRAEPAGEASARKTARFSNVSLILTALSVSAGLLFLPIILRMWDVSDRRPNGIAGWIVLLLLIGVAAVPGTMLAMRALREIRSSGGKVAGFKRAIVAALTWPALLVVLTAAFGLRELFDDSGVSIAWRALLCLVLLAASGLGVVMMRQVARWMKNSLSEETPSRHVWRFAAAAFVAVFCVGAFVPHKASSSAAYREPSGTKGTWKLTVGAGKMTTYRVVRIDVRGHEAPLEIGGTIVPSAGQDFFTTLQVVSTNRWKDNPRQQLTASYPVLSGETYSRTAFLDDQWEFVTSGNANLPLLEGQKERFEIATRRDWFGKKLETLYLEIVATTQLDDQGKESPRSPASPSAVKKQP